MALLSHRQSAPVLLRLSPVAVAPVGYNGLGRYNTCFLVLHKLYIHGLMYGAVVKAIAVTGTSYMLYTWQPEECRIG